MPFQSEKQRRYMHANLPEIANRWEKKYGLGGIAELNSQLNSLPEYYLPKNQGGRIGFDNGSNGITLGSDKYNITLEPGASGSLSSQDLGHGYNVDEKNIAYGVDTTANIGPVEIGMDYEKFLDKYDVTENGTTVEKDTNRDRSIAYMLGLNLEDLYAKIDSDKDFKNFYFTIRKTFSGGGTPSHEASIYGLAEGGRTGFYRGSDRHAGTTSSSSSNSPGHPSNQGSTKSSSTGSTASPSRDTGSDYGQFDRAVSQAANNPPSTKSDSGGDGVYQDRIIRIAEQDKRTKELRDKASNEGWHQFVTPKAPPQAKKTITPGSVGVNLLTTFLTGGISNPWTKAAANRVVKWGANKIGVDNMINTFVDEKFGSIDEMKSKIEARVAKEDLIQSLPRGHPERIQLEESVKTKTTPKDGPDGEGVTETSITIDNIEEVNDAKTQLQQKYQEMDEASLLAWQRQQEMQAKKEAYLKNFRQMYMSAQGGRVPAGYNTGGLSNLFRLKNV